MALIVCLIHPRARLRSVFQMASLALLAVAACRVIADPISGARPPQVGFHRGRVVSVIFSPLHPTTVLILTLTNMIRDARAICSDRVDAAAHLTRLS